MATVLTTAVTTVPVVIISQKPFNQEQAFHVLQTAAELCLEENRYSKLCFQTDSIYLESGAGVRRTILSVYNKLPYIGYEVSRDLINLPALAAKVKTFIIGMSFQDLSHLEASRNFILDAAAGFVAMKKNQYTAQTEKEGLIDNAVAVLRSTEEFFSAAVKIVPMKENEAVKILKELSLLDTQLKNVPIYFSDIQELRFFRKTSPHISSLAGRAEHITLLPALLDRVIAVISTTEDHRLRSEGLQALETSVKGLEALKAQNKDHQENLPLIDKTITTVKEAITSSSAQNAEFTRKTMDEFRARADQERREKEAQNAEKDRRLLALEGEVASLKAQLHVLSGRALEHVKPGENVTDKELIGKAQVLLAMLAHGEQSQSSSKFLGAVEGSPVK
jgi:F0F1-type ATP synthase epsilon subunit